MRLTKKKAIELSIELWTWLAETGEEKREWPGWEKYGQDIWGDCFFCEYDKRHQGDTCTNCPYYQRFGSCGKRGSPFSKWNNSHTTEDCKKYATQFLEQLRQL